MGGYGVVSAHMALSALNGGLLAFLIFVGFVFLMAILRGISMRGRRGRRR